MRHFFTAAFFFSALWFSIYAQAANIRFPDLIGRVVDNANLLSVGAEQSLSQELELHENKTGEQIVVVTLPSLGGVPIEDFGYQLGRAWGIGQKGKNNGALLIVAPAEHAVRIEVGYGLEGLLTDAASSQIINNIIVPSFRDKDFEGGIVKGTQAILATLDGEDISKSLIAEPSKKNQTGLPLNWIFWLLIFCSFLFRSRRRRSLLGPLVMGTMLGRSSGGFGSGGFRGGGGGFGGGGASGRW